jgi:hypothetical protein
VRHPPITHAEFWSAVAAAPGLQARCRVVVELGPRYTERCVRATFHPFVVARCRCER